MNVSWYQAKKACSSYNATLLILTNGNDVNTAQAFIMDTLDDVLPLPIFLGLKKAPQVRLPIATFISCYYHKCTVPKLVQAVAYTMKVESLTRTQPIQLPMTAIGHIAKTGKT